MEQTTINQRLKFLVEKLNFSSRAFSEHIGESPTNTHNYIGSRQAEPRASYLINVLSHFKDVSPTWLMTGEGEPFLSSPQTGISQTGNFNQVGNSNSQKVKGNRNNVQTTNGDNNTITNVELEGCRRDLAAATKENELLRSQLADKERIIQLLEKSK